MNTANDQRNLTANALEAIHSELRYLGAQTAAQEILFARLLHRLDGQGFVSQSGLLNDLNLVADVTEESGLRHQLEQLSDRLSCLQERLQK